MNESNLREQLLCQETGTPSLRENYERKLKEMMEKELNGMQRWLWRGAVLYGLLTSVAFGIGAALSTAQRLPWEAAVAFGVGSLFSLIWVFLCVRILHRNKMYVKRDANRQAGLFWMFVCILICLGFSAAFKLPDNKGPIVLLIGVALLVMGIGSLLVTVVEKNSLTNREQMLKIELRIAELTKLVAECIKQS